METPRHKNRTSAPLKFGEKLDGEETSPLMVELEADEHQLWMER